MNKIEQAQQTITDTQQALKSAQHLLTRYHELLVRIALQNGTVDINAEPLPDKVELFAFSIKAGKLDAVNLSGILPDSRYSRVMNSIDDLFGKEKDK